MKTLIVFYFYHNLSGPIVDVEECEDYLLAEEQSKEKSNEISTEARELKDSKPEVSETVPQDIVEQHERIGDEILTAKHSSRCFALRFLLKNPRPR